MFFSLESGRKGFLNQSIGLETEWKVWYTSLRVRTEEKRFQMKKKQRNLRILWIAFCLLFVFVGALATYDKIMIKTEADKIIPNGQMVNLGEYSVHVFTDGDNTEDPTLVFLSGSATVAPVYDFKSLYRLLASAYRIAVVEKAGYGYSDIVDVERDVASMVEEVRSALSLSGIKGSYVLLPHSMSGLEALYWAQHYPEEIAGIVGLDMSVPYSYDELDLSITGRMITLGRLSKMLGLLRIPGIYPVNESPLTESEVKQQRMLIHRNAVNSVYIAEGNAVYDNAQIVKAGGKVSCPILMFCSDGTEIGDFWIPTQKQFAEESHAELILFDCGHYLHYYESDRMATSIQAFVEGLPRAHT